MPAESQPATFNGATSRFDEDKLTAPRAMMAASHRRGSGSLGEPATLWQNSRILMLTTASRVTRWVSSGKSPFKMHGLAALLCLLPLGTNPAQDDAQAVHGTFTGEVKPVLYVSDVEERVPFYRDVLGFKFDGFSNSDGEPYYAETIAGGLKFGLHEPMSEDQEDRVGQQRLYFRVKDVQLHRRRVDAWGGNPGKMKQTDWMDMFIVKDPDGNEIVFATTDLERHSIDPW